MQPSSLSTYQPVPSPKEAIPYSSAALRQDLDRPRGAWEDAQSSRDRNAIYGYLSAVYGLDGGRPGCRLCPSGSLLVSARIVSAGRSLRRSHPVHRRPGQGRQTDPEQVVPGDALRGGVQAGFGATGAEFIRRKGGINACAARFAW
jgi:hypothetical protein